MKKQIIFLFAAFIMVFSINANSIKPVIVKIKKAEQEKTLDIIVANLQNKNTQISILDVEGKSWYFQNISREVGFGMNFNLEGMPDNDYVVFIKNKNGQYFQTFSMEGNDITFFDLQNKGSTKNLTASLEKNEMKETPQLITKVTAEEKRSLGVRLANLKKAQVTLRLFSDSGSKIQTEKVDNEHAYAKKWDLQNVSDGNYFLYIESENTTIVQFIVVERSNIQIGAVQRLDL